MSWQRVLQFWFDEIDPALHWRKDHEFDRLIENRFGELHRAAGACELFHWRDQPQGRLAEVIILDQFSRHIYRDRAQSFAADGLALALAQEAVRLDLGAPLTPAQRAFLYLPYMHSESVVIHQQAERLFSQPGLEDNYRFELRHKAIIDRFGRYPHRNRILGRQSSAEEIAFLQQPGSSF